MPRNGEVEIQGLAALQKALKQLPERAQRAAVRPAVTKASRVVRKRAKQLMPKGPGFSYKDGQIVMRKHLRQMMGVKVRTNKSTGAVFARIGPVAGPFYHAHLVEFGTTQRQHESGRPTGAAPAQHVLQRTFEQTKSQVASILVRETFVGIQKQANKLAAAGK